MAGENIGQIILGLDINQKFFNKKLNGIANGANRTVMGAFKPMGKMLAGALAGGAVISFTKSCLKLGSDLQEVQNVVDVTFPSMSEKVNQFASSAIDKFGLSETVAKKMMGTYGAMTKSFGYTETEAYKMSEAVTGLTADIASFYNLSTDEAYTKMKSIWTGETESLKELGVVMTQTALDQYALNNGFGKTTKNLSEQEKVMLRCQYVTSRLSAASGDFARTQGGWANQTRVLTLRFEQLKATLGQGFINLFTPILKLINAFIAKIQNAANVFLKLTEIITGKKIESNMGGVASDVGDVSSAASEAGDNISGMGDSAASAAKKALRSLAGFDNINKLNEKEKPSGGSSGDSSVGGGAAGMIAQEINIATEAAEKLEDKLVGMVNKVKEAWKTGDFTEIGQMIGSKLTGSLDEIPWEIVKEGISKAAKSIATFFNGAIDGADWKLIGGTIAEGLNTAVLGIDTFLTTFDWKNAAKSVADTINGFVKKTDFSKLGEAIAHAVNACMTSIITFVKTIDWSEMVSKVGDALHGFFEEINMGDCATVILTVLGGNLAKLGTKELFKAAGDKILTSLGEALAGSGSISAMLSSIGTTLSTAFTTDLPLLFGAGTFAECATAIVGGVFAAIGAAIAGWNIGQWIYDKFSDQIDAAVFAVCDFFTKTLPAAIKNDTEFRLEFAIEVLGKLDEKATIIKNWFDDKKDQVKQLIAKGVASGKDAIDNIKSSWNGLQDKTKNLIAKGVSVGKDVLDKINATWKGISTKTKTLKAKLKDEASSKLSKLKTMWNSITSKGVTLTARFADSFTKPLKTAWNALAGKINNAITTINKIPGVNIPGRVPTFAKGGFPEEGPFMMNKGEIAGKFSNGKSVVANNAQITKGISDAVGPSVYSAVRGAMSTSISTLNNSLKNVMHSISTPSLQCVSSGNLNRTLERILDVTIRMVEGNKDVEMLQVMKEIFDYLLTMDPDVYMDGEKVTKHITDIINHHTRVNGKCEIET